MNCSSTCIPGAGSCRRSRARRQASARRPPFAGRPPRTGTQAPRRVDTRGGPQERSRRLARSGCDDRPTPDTGGMRPAWTFAVGVLAVTFFAQAATARCVRDVAPSGAVSVRCSDGVRGYLPSDDQPPPTASSARRAPDWSRSSRSRSEYVAPTASPSPYSYQSGDPARRPSDSAASALSRGRTDGSSDRRLY